MRLIIRAPSADGGTGPKLRFGQGLGCWRAGVRRCDQNRVTHDGGKRLQPRCRP